MEALLVEEEEWEDALLKKKQQHLVKGEHLFELECNTPTSPMYCKYHIHEKFRPLSQSILIRLVIQDFNFRVIYPCVCVCIFWGCCAHVYMILYVMRIEIPKLQICLIYAY